MKPLPKQYDPKEAEPRLQKQWEAGGVYAWDESQPRENTFVIDTPPPTVSGVLHMGHIFSYTQADFVARFQRMSGKTVFYPMGFDDNGLPTERLVEKIKGRKASQYPSREAFVADCREVVKSAEDEFRTLFKSVALSVDWAQEYQTVSDDVRKLSQQSFLDLLQKGEAYRDFRPTYWDWVDQTAIAQAEIENKEMPGVMHEIAFTLEDGPHPNPLPHAGEGADTLAGEAANKPSPAGGRGLGEGPIHAEKNWKTPKQLTQTAQALRKQGTKAEALIWSCLRDRQLQGHKFRRQHPVELYIADFACIESKLIVEVDGGQHGDPHVQAKDSTRTEFLESRGFTLLRFWNNDVFENLEGVLETIASALAERGPHPNLLPQAGEGMAGPVEEGRIVIATTRPELLGACVAVMYHPDDPNATKYKGKYAVTPVFGVKVPMIADELVEQGKGTGLVMCCTFGDDTDKEWVRKYRLPIRSILYVNGKITFKYNPAYGTIGFNHSSDGASTTIPAEFNKSVLNKKNCIDLEVAVSAFEQINNSKPKQAQAKILELLSTNRALLKQTNIAHTVKCAERSGTPIEIIPTYQWFVKVTDKKDALKAKGAACEWHPEFMKLRLDQWIDGLKEDWCVSRQRFFGVPFPVWYSRRAGEEGKILFAEPSQLPVDPLVDLPNGYSREEVDADKDVMDTWATSSLSPQINARGISPAQLSAGGRGLDKLPLPLAGEGWGEGGNALEGNRYSKLFPADLRPQAHEIIRTWAFYTIVKSHLHAGDIPWKNLMISGWCLAADKTKMSKSKGNVVTPVDLIRDKGADAVRYWASTSRLGSDTAFSEDLLKIGKKLVTKLWNATSFAAIHIANLTEDFVGRAAGSNQISEVLDRWILSRLHKTIAKATREFERFEYCDARVAVEDFFWKDFCDNYLELVKARAYGEIGDKASQASAHLTLYHCLHALLKLFAPFIPHVTEELFTYLFEDQGSVHARGQWPKASDYPVDEAAETAGSNCVKVLEVIRMAKSDKKVSIKAPLKRLILSASAEQDKECHEQMRLFKDDLQYTANAASCEWVYDEQYSALPAAGSPFRVGFEWAEALVS